MPNCPKCHRWRAKKIFNRHKKNCIPDKECIDQYLKSKSSAGRETTQ